MYEDAVASETCTKGVGIIKDDCTDDIQRTRTYM